MYYLHQRTQLGNELNLHRVDVFHFGDVDFVVLEGRLDHWFEKDEMGRTNRDDIECYFGLHCFEGNPGSILNDLF